jgi:hypothetical protein
MLLTSTSANVEEAETVMKNMRMGKTAPAKLVDQDTYNS